MKRWIVLTTAALAALTLAQAGMAQSAPAASAPASAASTSGPATASAPSPEVMKVLRDLEAVQAKRLLKADIVSTVELGSTGETETRTGTLAVARGDRRLRISFATLDRGDGAVVKDSLDYVFDGEWLWIVKPRIKTVEKRQVAARGEKNDPLRLGQGPIPLPIGQSADDMVKYFNITTRPPTAKDPKNTTYLKLVPRPERLDELSFVRIEMWVDNASHLPVKLIGVNKNDPPDVTTMELKNVQTSDKLDEGLFKVTVPRDYDIKIIPLDGK